MDTLLACSVSEGADLTNKLLNVSRCLADTSYSPPVAGQEIEAAYEKWTNKITSVYLKTLKQWDTYTDN